MKELNNYIIALVNLYGLVHRDRVMEIYNSQNKIKVSKTDLDTYFDIPKRLLEENFIAVYKDYFVDTSFLEVEKFDMMLEEKSDKPYYVPEKEELLKYAKGIYYEKNKEYQALVDYIGVNFSPDDPKTASNLAEEVQMISQITFNIQLIMDSFNEKGIVFKSVEQANELANLVMNVANNVRLWKNNGYTSRELSEILDNYKYDYSDIVHK